MKRTLCLGLLFTTVLAAGGCSKDGDFPRVDLKGGESFEGLSIGLPPGATAAPEKSGKVVIKGDGYMIDVSPAASSFAEAKENFGGKGFHVETTDGFIAKDDGKDGKTFPVVRIFEKGDTKIECSARPPDAPTTIEKAKEALAVCSSLQKK